MIKYSIIIPVYNVEDYLPSCIESVLKQDTTSAFEIILIDDGSPDGCGDICDIYASRYENIKVFHIENHGVSYARNLGIQNACGHYILFLDSDDLWENMLLQSIDKALQDKTDMVAFYSYRLFEDGKKEPMYHPLLPENESGTEYLSRIFSINKTPWFFTWSYVYRKDFLIKNNLFFDETLKVSEDFEQIMRSIPLAENIVGCNIPLYNYRIRQSSVTASLNIKKLTDNLLTKAYFYHLYPCAAMANLYVNNAILSYKLKKEDYERIKQILVSNKDIWKFVSEPPLKLGRILTTIFGFYNGSKIYAYIRHVSRQIKSLFVK